MSYITDIFRRANLQQIREFLLIGVESRSVSKLSYKQRLAAADKAMLDELRRRFPEQEEQEMVYGMIQNYTSSVKDIYMEIGLQCGATIAKQLAEETDIF